MIFLFHFVQWRCFILQQWCCTAHLWYNGTWEWLRRLASQTAAFCFHAQLQSSTFPTIPSQHHLPKTGPTATVFSSLFDSFFIFSFEEHNTKREDLEIRVPLHQEIHILTAPPCPLPSVIETVLPLSCWGRETTCNLRRFLEMRWQTSLLLLIWEPRLCLPQLPKFQQLLWFASQRSPWISARATHLRRRSPCTRRHF